MPLPGWRKPLEQSLWSKVQKTDTCWLWTGCCSKAGYGVLSSGGKKGKIVLAHRLVYTLLAGPIPDGMELDHCCNNPRCVRPDKEHVRPMTHRDNIMRGNSFSAVHARKTHCPRGHLLAGTNLIQYDLKRGQRSCRICRDIWQQEHRNRLKT